MQTIDEMTQNFKAAQQNPVGWCREVLGVKTLTWQGHIDILNAFTTHKKVSVKSGHSMGKDFISGLLSLWFLYSFPESVVITTAPTARQVEKIVWGEIHKYWQAKLGGKVLSTSIEILPNWYALGFTTKDANQVGKFQGFKSRNLLVIVTEAQAVDDSIYEQIDGIMTSDNSYLYLAGNPTRADGEFIRSFSDPSFKTFTYSAYESPNYIAGKEIIPGMASRAWVEHMERKWGKESPMFKARVLGEILKQSANSLISLESCYKSLNAMPTKGWRVLAVDPARYGDDYTAFVSMQGGKMIECETEHGKPTPETEGKILAKLRKGHYDIVAIDEGAMGAGIYDHIDQVLPNLKDINGNSLDIRLVPFNFGSSPQDKVQFANLGTESYFKVCNQIEQGMIQLADDGDLFAQLSARKYKFNNKGQMILESKEDLKKRGLPSPDRADALVMACSLSLDDGFVENKKEREETEFDAHNIETDEFGCPVIEDIEVYA